VTNPTRSSRAPGATRASASRLAQLLAQHQNELIAEWLDAQGGARAGASEIRRQGREFIDLLAAALANGDESVDGRGFEAVRAYLADLSKTRAEQGYSSSETATFVFALKGPIFSRLRSDATDAALLGEDIWYASQLLDSLGLQTVEAFQRGREGLIARQQQDMLELSTPVVALWEGVLALPMIGTLDSARTQVVMETLLQRIVDTGADIAILDITGVPTVDTLTAQHLLKTVTAARLMGAECIISGIRPQIAQTIVHLGVDLGNVTTKASLADAFRLALQRTGRAVVRTAGPASGGGSMASPAPGTPRG